MRTLITITLIFSSIWLFADKDETGSEKNRVTLSGQITDKSTGEDLIGASVYIESINAGTITNTYGFYSLSVPPGKYTVKYSYIGFETISKELNLSKNISLNIELGEAAVMVKEVVVAAKGKNENIKANQMSVVKIDAKAIEKIPALMGEVDVIKAIQLLPGVQASGEGSSGFSVRGGSRDQNLILLDEAAVYNASHLMGFFSVFNNDAIKDVQLYKGDIPTRYGGRLSSLLDIRMKDGNAKKFSGRGGIGTISSRLTIEGPLVKDKGSFIVSGRRSYADVFLAFAKNPEVRQNTLYFYDLNGKINYRINNNNRLYLSTYGGRDVFKVGDDDPFKISWGNRTATLRWNHLFSDKLFSNFTFLKSDYDYQLGLESGINGFNWYSKLHDYTLKGDLGYYLNPKNTLRMGGGSTYHHFIPGHIKGVGTETIFNELKVPESKAMEYFAYLSNEQKIGALLTVKYGLRVTTFQNVGKTRYFLYDKSNPQEYIDTSMVDVGQWDVYNTYTGFEPRFSFNYLLSENSSIKGSYSHTYQFVHLVSNSAVGSPLDIWLPSSPNIKPQKADQGAIGYFRNFFDGMLEASVEVYYKKMYNQLDFKDHAQLMLNDQLEKEIRTGTADSYGIELLLRKQEGKFTGWIGYTYSKTERLIPEINNGKAFAAPYDKPHDVSIVASYQFTDRISASATWVYSTGAPFTAPAAKYEFANMTVPYYTGRNEDRMPDYHRLDLGVTIDGKKKNGKLISGSWTFSVYNVYYRKNAYMISFSQDDDQASSTKVEKTYLFPIIPAVTYNFKF